VAGRHRKTHPPRGGERSHHGRHRKPASRQRAVVPTVTAVAVLAVGGVMFGHAVADGQPPHAASAAVPQAPSLPPPVVTVAPKAPTAPVSPAKANKPRRPPHHRVVHHRAAPAALAVTDVGPACYLQVTTSNGQLLARRILHGGQHVVFRRHGLDVVLGNAGGVRISVDGRRAHLAGRSGQVRSFHVS
jgi:Domain of unknown function (DUF4115)